MAIRAAAKALQYAPGMEPLSSGLRIHDLTVASETGRPADAKTVLTLETVASRMMFL